MGKLDSILNTLIAIRRQLDVVASDIHQAQLDPVREHLRHIVTALRAIAAIEDRIYEIQPELEPSYMKEARARWSGMNMRDRLDPAIHAAHDLRARGDVEGAILVIDNFIESQTADLTEKERTHVRRMMIKWSSLD